MTIAKTASELKGNLVHLRPFHPSFITEQYVAWLNDKTLMRYSEQRHKTHDLDSCHRYLESMVSQGHYFWAILEATTSHHIGNLTAYLDRQNKTANLAILIGEKPIQGKGYGLQAWTLALNHLLEVGFRKVNAGTMAENTAMRKIFEKSGMQLEGIRQKEYLLDGQEVDQILVTKFKR